MGLFQCHQLEMVMIRAEQKLADLMNTEKCQIYLIDNENSQLIRFNNDKDVKINKTNIGIIGECLKFKIPIETVNPYTNPIFNTEVDLDTQMCMITIPVKKEEDDKIVAIIQLANVRFNLSKNSKKNTNNDLEIINFFSRILIICIENAFEVKKIINQRINEGKKKTFKKMSCDPIQI